jgi:hypothetical protein
MPFFDIHLSITPDVLHQLWQGVFKYLAVWSEVLLSEKELDDMLKRLPPGQGVHYFKDGWSHLSQISGSERKDMAKVILGCLVGKLPPYGILAYRSLLDFIYLAQYTTHDDTTLSYMEDALKTFHDNKHFFTDVEVREHLNITKFHSLLHYVDSIKLFGTTDNYSTELFEHLHIDFSKEGWRASNHRDAYPQMIRWLTRKEKMQAFKQYIDKLMLPVESLPQIGAERNTTVHSTNQKSNKGSAGTAFKSDGETHSTCMTPVPVVKGQPRFTSGAISYTVAKYPRENRRKIAMVAKDHKAPFLNEALILFLNTYTRKPESTKNVLIYYTNPIPWVDIFYQFKIFTKTDDPDIIPGKTTVDAEVCDVVKAHRTQEQYDTVIVMWNDRAESTGLEGTRVGRVRVIFRLPTEIEGLPVPKRWPKQPLAYIEWYAPLQKGPQNDQHLMYKVKKGKPGEHGIIIPVTQIRQSCMLYPLFSAYSKKETASWTHKTVLDDCDTFLLNNWASKHCYHTIW